jgi:DNA mismatch repair protein MutS
MALVKEYLDITKNYKELYGEKTLVLMQVGSFYECYAIKKEKNVYEGSNILDFTQINDMVIANKNTVVDGNEIVMAGFGLAQKDKYVKKMIAHGYTVLVYDQTSDTKNTTRTLDSIYSPGTFFDNNDYYSLSHENSNNENSNINSNLSNNTICIWIHYSKLSKSVKTETITIGLNIINIFTGKIISYEYCHQFLNTPTTYDQLEKYISIYNPAEAIIITNITNNIYNANNCSKKNDKKNDKNMYIDDVISFANIHADKIYKIYLDETLENKNKNEKEKEKEKESKNKIISFEKVAFNCEKQIYQQELIDKIYGQGSYREKYEFQNYYIANQSLCFLIDFMYKHNPSLIKNISYPCFDNVNSKLILANHSLKQLNMISDQRHNGKLGCVANFLNNCITNAGKRKFHYDLLHPLCDVDVLNDCYNVTEHLIKTEFYKIIREYLLNVRDIEKLERKVFLGKIDPKDFAVLYSNLSNVSKLFEKIINIKENNELAIYINKHINCNISNLCSIINKYIEQTFNLDKLDAIVIDKLNSYSLDELVFINENYNEEQNILFKNNIDSKQQLEVIGSYFSNLLSDYEKPKTSKNKSKAKKTNNNEECNDETNLENEENNESYGASYVKIHETSKNEALLLITKRRATILNELLQKIIKKSGAKCNINYISKYSKKNETIELDLSTIVFKNHGTNNSNNIIDCPHIVKIAQTIQNSREDLIITINKNYKNIIAEFNSLIVITSTTSNNSNHSNVSLLGKISQFIAQIDVCYARTYNAVKYNYCKPIINNELCENTAKSYVNFKKIRHCLIEHLNSNELYVTNDLSIGSNTNGILLYGTNAVGKTSFIKSLGIAIIMAQAGMYVPCEEFTYYPYEYLFTRILGNDNIFKGLSTFAVEMSELRTILKNATSKSIILGDELCSGTETTSALSIFVASLERLHTLESTFLFATHFHEVLDYEEVKNLCKMKIYHMSVYFDYNQNTLIYDRKLREGSGDSMYGLEVCKSLALPDDFIERAYSIRNKYNKYNVSILEAKKSRYNSNKLRIQCEICNASESTEVHHLQFQKNAKNGIINGEFNKNHKANLINICEACHQKIHSSNQEFRITKTSNGYKLLPL